MSLNAWQSAAFVYNAKSVAFARCERLVRKPLTALTAIKQNNERAKLAMLQDFEGIWTNDQQMST
jgi:hypothetical protein